jgi:hypothetical protein
MGYYTHFELTYEDPDVDEDQLAAELTEISTYDWDGSLILGDAKWYSWVEDMTKLSQMYPNTVFELSGDGEEKDDQWICYFKDGKKQLCEAKITFDPYDESKLK